jgi:hypothetical protein
MAKIPKKRRPGQRKASPQPRTEEQFRALPERVQETWNRAAHVLTEMRHGSSLRRAAIEVGIDPRTVRRLAGPALRKLPAGRYLATKSDRLLRMLILPTPSGLAEIAIKGSRDASTLAEYWNAVELFLQTGDETAVGAFKGRAVTNARGERVPLLTDPDELERLGSAGVLSFESLYARAG